MSKRGENKMPQKYDCVRDVKKKIKSGKFKKNFRCDSLGNPNKRGKKRCKSNAHVICSKLKWLNVNKKLKSNFM